MGEVNVWSDKGSKKKWEISFPTSYAPVKKLNQYLLPFAASGKALSATYCTCTHVYLWLPLTSFWSPLAWFSSLWLFCSAPWAASFTGTSGPKAYTHTNTNTHTHTSEQQCNICNLKCLQMLLGSFKFHTWIKKHVWQCIKRCNNFHSTFCKIKAALHYFALLNDFLRKALCRLNSSSHSFSTYNPFFHCLFTLLFSLALYLLLPKRKSKERGIEKGQSEKKKSNRRNELKRDG